MTALSKSGFLETGVADFYRISFQILYNFCRQRKITLAFGAFQKVLGSSKAVPNASKTADNSFKKQWNCAAR